MIQYFSDLKYKEVIDIHSGNRMGYVCDAEYDDDCGQLISVITPGKAKFFGLFGWEDDIVIPWTDIVHIGHDILMIDKKDDFRSRKRRSFFSVPE